MKTFQEFYDFLRSYYLHSRFEGSDMVTAFPDYAETVTKSSMAQVEQTGKGFISLYECRLGRTIIFDGNLNILNPDEPPAQIQARPGVLTQIYSHK